ncbi:MAG: prepilin peptidase [Acidobacteriia bacterium]|nr:prepilin peptidase [Terriglobia bacterium]
MDPVLATAVFLFGLAFGSFLNVCIHRIPREISVVLPHSACPKCQHAIKPYDNIPVLSWLILRGRCRHCGAPISPRYLAVEVITACLFLACYARFGMSILALKYCVFSFLIIGLIFIDAEWRLLPDAFTLSGLAVGLGFSGFAPLNDVVSQLLPGILGPRHSAISWRLLSVGDAMFGAAAGASFFYGVAILYLHARGREGMGLGDVKLMAMVGAFLGVRLTVLTIFGASLVGSLFGLGTILMVWIKRTRRRRERNRESAAVARRRAWQSARTVYRYYEIPFGVFLGAMAMIALFFGPALLRWYWGMYL